MPSHNFIDLTGHRYGRLLVISRAANTQRGQARWNCTCDCGNQVTATADQMRTGRTSSCGCFAKEVRSTSGKRRRTHGQTREKYYRVWVNMIYRCHNPTAQEYERYGARGISVCARWRESFEAFATDMGPRPDKHSLDRIDNSGNYEPGNCRWATGTQQSNNRRSTRIIKVGDLIGPVADVARALGVTYSTIAHRARRGQDGIQYVDGH